METAILGSKLKKIRKSKGLSQEELAFKTGLSLRTIQRIENGESEPRGDSLKRISEALDVSVNHIYDWGLQEDKSTLKTLNFSCLSFLLFPLLGILVPFLIWSYNKNSISGVNQLGKMILNYQITWCIIYSILLILFAFVLLLIAINDLLSLKELASFHLLTPLIIWIIMSILNLKTIFLNNKRIKKEFEVEYKPRIQFLK